ncbi:MAG: thioredoxin [Victivallaceae bacterium]|nr:thioredoxin [Victivallaceae bacterium]
MAVKELNKDELGAAIASGVAVVDFWATWCGPCKMMLPVFDQVSGEIEGASCYKFNIEDSPEAAAAHGVSNVPTFIVFKDGKAVNQVSGIQSKVKLTDFIKKSM